MQGARHGGGHDEKEMDVNYQVQQHLSSESLESTLYMVFSIRHFAKGISIFAQSHSKLFIFNTNSSGISCKVIHRFKT